jgi:hypothetical protein
LYKTINYFVQKKDLFCTKECNLLYKDAQTSLVVFKKAGRSFAKLWRNIYQKLPTSKLGKVQFFPDLCPPGEEALFIPKNIGSSC